MRLDLTELLRELNNVIENDRYAVAAHSGAARHPREAPHPTARATTSQAANAGGTQPAADTTRHG